MNWRGPLAPRDNPNWYDWRIANWGTKWDVNVEGVDIDRRSPSELHYSFWSAWCGPYLAVPTISAAFPSLRFQLRHSDECMDWDESLTCVGGKVMERIETTFDNPNTCEYWGCPERCDECGCDLDECDCEGEEVKI